MATAASSTSGMYRKILATKAKNAAAASDAARQRASCPFEAARRFLQSRGHPVYAESVHNPKSSLFIVGSKRMTRKELRQFANEVEAREALLRRDRELRVA